MTNNEEKRVYKWECKPYVERIESEEMRKFLAQCDSGKSEYVRIMPFNLVLSESMVSHLERIESAEVRDDDIWVCSFPKTGTTWTSELVWCLMHDVDLATAKTVDLDDRVPFFEYVGLGKGADRKDTIVQVAELSSPRVIKTHLSHAMLPAKLKEKATKAKIIYVTRNVRDVALSRLNHARIFDGYQGDLETFLEAFINDVGGNFSPFFSHVKGFYELAKKDDKILFLQYEEMKRNLSDVIDRVNSFLGKPELSLDRKEALVRHLDFDQMKHNNAVNKSNDIKAHNARLNRNVDETSFMMRGVAGNWRGKLDEKWIQRFQQWEKKEMNNCDLLFEHN